MNDIKYKHYSTAKFWLEEGWYTVADLESILDCNKRINDHLRKSMEPTEEKK